MHETAASFATKPETSPERQAFYIRLDENDNIDRWAIHYVGQLDEMFFQAMMVISGLA